MNYRRGFQRVYVVLTVVWVALVLIVSIRDRPRYVNYDALASKYGGVDAPGTARDKTPEQWVVQSETPMVIAHLQYWTIRCGAAILAPAVVYLFLFSVLPWIYRGFKARA